jgi:hypothetical protein
MSSDESSDTESNPLEDLYVDADAIDQERIRGALDGLIGIDRNSGEPRFYEKFDELDTKRKFTALLLYRRALAALGDLEDDESLGTGSTYFADLIDVDSSTIRHASNDLDFATNDDSQGGYYIPAHRIKSAASFLESDNS